MATALFNNFLYDDAIIPINASGTALTITKGDYVIFSGVYGIAGQTALAGAKVSGVGIAMGNNPWYDELGVARANSALPVLVRGVVRVTATSGAHSALGLPVFPTTTGSGIVGQTGATGMGAIWMTAAYANVSAGTSYVPGAQGGVAKLINIVSTGSTGQWDIMLFPQRPDFI
jgi:hypothetical protein